MTPPTLWTKRLRNAVLVTLQRNAFPHRLIASVSSVRSFSSSDRLTGVETQKVLIQYFSMAVSHRERRANRNGRRVDRSALIPVRDAYPKTPALKNLVDIVRNGLRTRPPMPLSAENPGGSNPVTTFCASCSPPGTCRYNQNSESGACPHHS